MSVAHSVKRRLAPAAKAVAPRLFWRRKYRLLQRLGKSSPDARLAASLCDPNRISLDIGADVGEVAIAMLPVSRSVIAFEPRPAQARDLAAMFAAVGAAVRVEAVALSDRPGVMAMRVVESEPGRSTIDTDNVLSDVDGGDVHSIDVPVKRLDDLQLDDVGLIKIDVEGHELAVVRGAAETLRRNRPVILVEAEERHRPGAVADITALLTGFGYAGYFEFDGARRAVEEFDPAQHQNPAHIGGPDDPWAVRGVYVNNFVFVPAAG
ncbi:FkbM family methyltransferase [Mycobacterium kansasii]|uniref:Methyltransferase, FkbM family domain protein n=3 Tax=Mycobacterium kansasii TaxID=1768 RepID=A0A1V3XNS7_MYCKA|nr:FkbM family methyltransferase [Mycobacterium kansasii]EUA01434.1 methyltransferase, FkbM family domain protein [Mycobacterium kansasii 824]ARG63326.1 methyltransferase [Mycobacterium kansasii]ARG70961.1 methyltransferase [Mycobacterium kansasii]ARG74479.1 methyltransferase [Mycobacterium kansasii]ARG79939.1 methyltransferase [Mycobacterium kansasii]